MRSDKDSRDSPYSNCSANRYDLLCKKNDPIRLFPQGNDMNELRIGSHFDDAVI